MGRRKLYLLICSIFLLFSGCTEEQQAKLEKRREEYKKCPYTVREFEYNGHDYLYFLDMNAYNSTPVGTFIHDPDCKKCKNDRGW